MSARPRSVSIYRSLLANLALVILLLSGATMALTFVGSERTVRMLSGVILRQTIDQVDLRLQRFFDPVFRDLAMLRSWGEAGLLDLDAPATINRLVIPLLGSARQLSAVIVADDRGREQFLLHAGTSWHSRRTRRDEWGDRIAWLEWTDERPDPVASWRIQDYDPRTRPWYRAATGEARARGAERSAVSWTEPYTFYTTGTPGITGTAVFRSAGRPHVAALDVLLSDVSTFTTALRAGENGLVMVLTDQGKVIGLPGARPDGGGAVRSDGLLGPPEALGIAVVTAAARALRESAPAGPRRFQSARDQWWVEARPFDLGGGRTLSIAVMVPESDLSGRLGFLRTGIVLIMVAGIALAIARGAVLARRYSRPIEALAKESDRIGRGDLEPGPPIRTSIAEVHRLTAAHEHMRQSLRTLLKLEGDLQVARRIQQDTLPLRIPAVRGFQIDAWNEAAEETGGDTYDVIGYRRSPGDGPPHLTDDGADGALLLLADATGHGIGPALSVTQVRAMLRMAVRAGLDLAAIVRNLNAQLCADLSDGRFVTAWLGELDGERGTIQSFSCGQGPLLLYRARDRSCQVLETDTAPLGCLDDLEVVPRPPVEMEPGDAFVALSDGVVDAASPDGEPFGTKRAIEVIVRQHGAPAPELLTSLRVALAEFARSGPAEDDQTVVVVTRSTVPA